MVFGMYGAMEMWSREVLLSFQCKGDLMPALLWFVQVGVVYTFGTSLLVCKHSERE